MEWLIVVCLAFFMILIFLGNLAITEIDRLRQALKEVKSGVYETFDACDSYQDQIDELEKERDTARVEMHVCQRDIEELKEMLSMQRLEILCYEEDLADSIKKKDYWWVRFRMYRDAVGALTKRMRLDIHQLTLNHPDE